MIKISVDMSLNRVLFACVSRWSRLCLRRCWNFSRTASVASASQPAPSRRLTSAKWSRSTRPATAGHSSPWDTVATSNSSSSIPCADSSSSPSTPSRWVRTFHFLRIPLVLAICHLVLGNKNAWGWTTEGAVEQNIHAVVIFYGIRWNGNTPNFS